MRSKPGFEPDSYEAQHPKEESPGCFLILLITVIGYFVFSAISRTTLSGFANKSDQFICYGTLLGLVILSILAKQDKKQAKQKLHEARQEWKRTCKSAQVAIRNRSSYDGGNYQDEYGIPHRVRSHYYLELDMTADQRAVAPNLLKTIRVDIYSNIYEKLEKRDTVRIYYKPEAPMTFLLEEEMP